MGNTNTLYVGSTKPDLSQAFKHTHSNTEIFHVNLKFLPTPVMRSLGLTWNFPAPVYPASHHTDSRPQLWDTTWSFKRLHYITHVVYRVWNINWIFHRDEDRAEYNIRDIIITKHIHEKHNSIPLGTIPAGVHSAFGLMKSFGKSHLVGYNSYLPWAWFLTIFP